MEETSATDWFLLFGHALLVDRHRFSPEIGHIGIAIRGLSFEKQFGSGWGKEAQVEDMLFVYPGAFPSEPFIIDNASPLMVLQGKIFLLECAAPWGTPNLLPLYRHMQNVFDEGQLEAIIPEGIFLLSQLQLLEGLLEGTMFAIGYLIEENAIFGAWERRRR